MDLQALAATEVFLSVRRRAPILFPKELMLQPLNQRLSTQNRPPVLCLPLRSEAPLGALGILPEPWLAGGPRDVAIRHHPYLLMVWGRGTAFYRDPLLIRDDQRPRLEVVGILGIRLCPKPPSQASKGTLVCQY